MKREPMAEKGIFMGYIETLKAYEIYIPSKMRVVIRRDVNFKEERAYQRSWDYDERESQTFPQQGGQVQGARPQGSRSTSIGGTSVLETSRALVVSSPSNSLGGPLVQTSHGTLANIGTGASIGSSRTGVVIGTPGSVGRPSSSPNWGVEDEVPYGEYSLGKRRPKLLQDTLKEAKSIGPPKMVNRKRFAPRWFCSYVAKATNIVDSELLVMRRLPARRYGEMLWWRSMPLSLRTMYGKWCLGMRES